MERLQSNNAEYSSSRLEAFSDGIFAIAITLLVLNIQLPENASEITINKALQLSVPKLEVWIISFLIVGGMWMRHHKLLKQVAIIDALFVKLNLIYLMFVTVIPWLVSLIVIYDNNPLAIVVFSGTITLLGFINLFMWIYLAKIKKALCANVSIFDKKITLLNSIIYIFISLGTIFIAYKISNSVALYCYILNPVIGVMLTYACKKLFVGHLII